MFFVELRINALMGIVHVARSLSTYESYVNYIHNPSSFESIISVAHK